MKEAIKEQLKKLEEERNIRILLAVESGSRAWGFPSPDSDFDVRIIYMHRPEWYLSVDKHKDTLSYFEGELLDISGWDIRKALRLIKRSNMSPAEWNQSPIVYQETEGFRNDLTNLVTHYFSPKKTIDHYRGIARNSFVSITNGGKRIKLKKLFYVIRPLLAALFVVRHKSVPPMNIIPLLEEVKEDAVKKRVMELIGLKETVNEDFYYEMEADILDFITTLMTAVDYPILPKEHRDLESDRLNNYFRQILSRK